MEIAKRVVRYATSLAISLISRNREENCIMNEHDFIIIDAIDGKLTEKTKTQ